MVTASYCTEPLRNKLQGLAIQSGVVQNSPQAFSAVEIEGENGLFGYAVKSSIRTEAHTPRFAKADIFVRRKDADETPSAHVVFANRRYGVRSAERVLARNKNGLVYGAQDIQRTQLWIIDQGRSDEGALPFKNRDAVVTLTVRTDSGCKYHATVGTEGKATWKRHDTRRQDGGTRRHQILRERQNGAGTARSHIVASVRSQKAPARVKPYNWASVANDSAGEVERQHPVEAAVYEQQLLRRLDREAARIPDSRIIAEDTDRPSTQVEGQERVVPIAIHATGARDNKPHSLLLRNRLRRAAYEAWRLARATSAALMPSKASP